MKPLLRNRTSDSGGLSFTMRNTSNIARTSETSLVGLGQVELVLSTELRGTRGHVAWGVNLRGRL